MMELRGGKQVYRLPKRECAKIGAARELCGELSQIAAMNPHASEANDNLAKLLEIFNED